MSKYRQSYSIPFGLGEFQTSRPARPPHHTTGLAPPRGPILPTRCTVLAVQGWVRCTPAMKPAVVSIRSGLPLASPLGMVRQRT